MGGLARFVGRHLAAYLAREVHVYGTAPATPVPWLRNTLVPGDVLLVEGHSRFSTAIKYLTQSTWSHAALYVGSEALAGEQGAADACFIEADVQTGVRAVGLALFAQHHTRICRPVGLHESDRHALIRHAVAQLGRQYDLRNVIDLARYLLPTPPVPARFRRRMLSLGSGDPTKAICSTLIAQVFQSIGYPVLPEVRLQDRNDPLCPDCKDEIYRIRHHSLFAPRDFDVSPYFDIIKPTLRQGFDFHAVRWEPSRNPDLARSHP